MEETRKYLRMLLNILIPLTGLYLVCFWGPKLLGFFMPFVIGWIVALIAGPLVRFLERRLKILRRHGSVLIIVIVLGGVLFLLYWGFSRLYVELAAFIRDLPQIYENAAEDINGALLNSRQLLEFLPAGVQTTIDQFTANLGTNLGSFFSKAAAPTVEIAGNVAKSIPSLLVNTVIVILSSYFFLVEQDNITHVIRCHAPGFVLRYMEYIKKDARGLIGGYFLAQFRIMFVVAVILAIGFLVLGVKYGAVLAILIAALDFLPVFGTGTALIPWALVKLFTAQYAYAAGLILLYITTQVVRQIIQPKIVGDSMGLPPLLTLFLLFIGFKVRGLAGMILAVPIGIIFINFYRYGAFDSLIQNARMLAGELDRFRKEEK